MGAASQNEDKPKFKLKSSRAHKIATSKKPEGGVTVSSNIVLNEPFIGIKVRYK